MQKDYVKFYKNISAPWRKISHGPKILIYLDTALRIIVACAYCALLLWLALAHDVHLLRATIVPLATFVLASIARAHINARRPYETFAIHALIPKQTEGHSMPSRHMTSATIIACTFLWAAGSLWGVTGFIVCALIGYIRIAGGVHFPRDIIAGAAFAGVCAFIGFIALGPV